MTPSAVRCPLSALLLAACAAPDMDQSFSTVDVARPETVEDTHDRFLDVIEAAEDELIVALPGLEQEPLAEAIVAAHDRGVDVRVVTDFDRAADPGVAVLQEGEVPLTLADDAIGYFDFSQGTDVAWTSDLVIMSHAFA